MDAHYRVVIFGSARIKEGDPLYDDVYFLSRELALLGIDIVTGGGPGLMQAASAGHKSVKSNTLSIGLNIKLPRRQPTSKFLDIKKEFDRFSSRLDTFMSLSDAVIVAPGVSEPFWNCFIPGNWSRSMKFVKRRLFFMETSGPPWSSG